MLNQQNKNEFYAKIVKDFEKNLGFKKEALMVLESLSFKLQEISKDLEDTDESIENIKLEDSTIEIQDTSKYLFLDYNGNLVINIFKDELGLRNVNPIGYYGLDNIKNIGLVEIVKDKNITIDNLDNAAEHIMKEISYEYDIDDNYYKCETIVTDYYCNTLSNYEFEHPALNLSSKNVQKDIIMYMINNYEDFDKHEFLDSYLINRSSGDCEALRLGILKFLDWFDFRVSCFKDHHLFYKQKRKISFNESLFLLFDTIYYLLTEDNTHNLLNTFKKQIIINYKLRDKFFKSLSILLDNPTVDNFEDIINDILEKDNEEDN